MKTVQNSDLYIVKTSMKMIGAQLVKVPSIVLTSIN
jgi:hypothetical protein